MFFFGRHSIFRMIFGIFCGIMFLKIFGGLLGFIAVAVLLGIGVRSFADEYRENQAQRGSDSYESRSYTHYNHE